MKKLLSFLLLTLMTVTLFSANVFADEEKLDVYVTISDENGVLVLAKEPVSVTDLDGDGVLTVNDALLAAHEEYCPNGYLTGAPYGDPIIAKLWGISEHEYGCFNNGGYVWRLTEYIAEDDHIQAFIYTDTKTKSDKFSYFSKDDLTFENGKATAALYAYTVTKDNNLLSRPVAGAVITVNGKDTKIKTDKNGAFTISAEDLTLGEKNVISARSEKELLVPPVLTVITDAADAEKSAPSVFVYLIVIVVVLTAGIFAVRLLLKKYHR